VRQVVLDTETTGLDAEAGHRIIEIGCIELVNRRPTQRRFHCYLNPERKVDSGAVMVHGIDDAFLATQPRFADIAAELLEFLRGAELVIHNADFDIEFLNRELRRVEGMPDDIRECCRVLDTLAVARRMHPGQRNSLDALAKRYNVDTSKRELHGALLDAQILAAVYLAMTGGQASLSLEGVGAAEVEAEVVPRPLARDGLVLVVQRATDEECAAHAAFLAKIAKKAGGRAVWHAIEEAAAAGSARRAPAVPDVADGDVDGVFVPAPA